MSEQNEKTYKDHIKTFLDNSASRSAFIVTVVDALHISGIIINKKNAEYVKLAMSLAMVIATSSYLSTGTACLIAGVLKTAGCPESTAKTIATAASFIVSASGNLTPIGIATTAVSTVAHYAAGKFGMWAKNRVNDRAERKRIESPDSPSVDDVLKNKSA